MSFVDFPHGNVATRQVYAQKSLQFIQRSRKFYQRGLIQIPRVERKGRNTLRMSGAFLRHYVFHDLVSLEILGHKYQVMFRSRAIVVPEAKRLNKLASP